MTAYYRQKLEEGLCYQDFVVEQLYGAGIPLISYSSKKYQNLIGENKAGIEIKFDQKFRETGNFYIETAEKSRAENPFYVASGIYRNDKTWLYLIGNYSSIYVFSKRQLQMVADKHRKVQTATSQGFLLPVDYAEKHLAIKIIHIAPA